MVLMATSSLSSELTPEVFQWIKSLPSAPEYHPTLTEFQDPIAYIFKIEKEASKYGICKIVPPVLPGTKKIAIANLNRSLAARASVTGDSSSSKHVPTFTTRQQQIGFCPRKPRPVQKPVWQSGEFYTFQEFEMKAKSFEKNYLKRYGKKGSLSALEVETLYWKATVDKPFSVEYANDMPGSAFVPVGEKKSGGGRDLGESATVGETAWNMRKVSRAETSLLRFMKEEIPGVTSPMVYIAMMFSWFAWHVEDHDLHSLNYMHMGAGKTWYGVPRDAAVAFEEVVRVHGYGGEVNPLVTFATLGEKTTVMSPEVFIRAGIPCCRLVQNAGEFVVTFPRAYHSGFSHGFNCGEAANIATPEWLRVAKDAAIRRASINYPPMVSHFQLLYDLALALCLRVPLSINTKPRSSRLKDKKKGEGEKLVKELFVQSVSQNNDILYRLGEGSPVVLLPISSSDITVCSELRVGSQLGEGGVTNTSEGPGSDNNMLASNIGITSMKGLYSATGKFASLCEKNRNPSLSGTRDISTRTSDSLIMDTEKENTLHGDGLSDQRLFSCVTCGILSFSCVAVIQPSEPAARYLMSSDCSFLNDWTVPSGITSHCFSPDGRGPIAPEPNSHTRRTEKSGSNGMYKVPAQSANYHEQTENQNNKVVSDMQSRRDTSALGLLASTYGESSDSEEDHVETDVPLGDETILSSEGKDQLDSCGGSSEGRSLSLSGHDFSEKASPQTNRVEFEVDDLASKGSNSLRSTLKDPITTSYVASNSSVCCAADKPKFGKSENASMAFAPRSDEGYSRKHVFCLEHAVEVEQQLRPIGGVHIMLLCHPEYPKIEAEAKLVAEELGTDYTWNNLRFRDATIVDEERLQSALYSEEAIPGSGDWAVKLGVNLVYSANLSRSPLYSKQMPYNSVIYNAFGRSSPSGSPIQIDAHGRRTGKQKKVVVGKWCGKVWMSNQVHSFLAPPDLYEQEQERSFRGRAMSDENLEKRVENLHKAETKSVTRKYSRKRKMSAKIEPIKKVKSLESEDLVSYDSLEDNSYSQHGRRSGRSKRAKKVEGEDAASYDSPDQNYDQQHRIPSRRKQANSVEREIAFSDDEVEDYSDLKHKRFLGGKQFKPIESDDNISDDNISDDSLEDYSHLQHTCSLGNKHPSSIEGEDEVSDDVPGDGSIQQHPPGKQVQYTHRDFTMSDDSMEEDSQSQQRSQASKHAEMEDAVSYGSPQKRRRIPRSRQPKVIERDDMVSYDSLEDNSNQRYRRIPRHKQAKCIEREDTVSYDSQDEDSSQNPHGRIPRSKQGKSIEREDAVSYDSLEDNYHQPQNRTLRSKKMKEETPQPRKQGKRCVTKQRTSGKKKQENLHLQNVKNEQNADQFDSYVEEEPEGGPSTRLRRRISKPTKELETKASEKKPTGKKNGKNAISAKAIASSSKTRIKDESEYYCDMEGCIMSFGTKQELVLHKRNICPVKGCGKKFFSHKYLVQHRRVHMDDRPLKCPWKGCKMSFKWAWARTEHIRVHTGARPYVCAEPDCGQTFRFVSDFSRHKRKTGHSVKKQKRQGISR